jgi:RHS repeat-associated protein
MGCLKIDISFLSANSLEKSFQQNQTTEVQHCSVNNWLSCILRCSNAYRFGFNGKENDPAIKGTGNSLDLGARIYDPRLGRFFSVDPKYKEFSFMSPYCIAAR